MALSESDGTTASTKVGEWVGVNRRHWVEVCCDTDGEKTAGIRGVLTGFLPNVPSCSLPHSFCFSCIVSLFLLHRWNRLIPPDPIPNSRHLGCIFGKNTIFLSSLPFKPEFFKKEHPHPPKENLPHDHSPASLWCLFILTGSASYLRYLNTVGEISVLPHYR